MTDGNVGNDPRWIERSGNSWAQAIASRKTALGRDMSICRTRALSPGQGGAGAKSQPFGI